MGLLYSPNYITQQTKNTLTPHPFSHSTHPSQHIHAVLPLISPSCPLGVLFEIIKFCCIYILLIRMDQYKLEYEKGSGTFSVVFTALSLKTGKYVAIKCMKKKFDSLEKVKKLK